MANVYYGDGGISTVTGNWNTAANWFSSTGIVCDCGPGTGSPLGRVPNIATDTVYLTSNTGGSTLVLTTGPTGNWSGTINSIVQDLPFGPYGSDVDLSGISASFFTGQFNLVYGTWKLGSGTYNQNIISTNGTVILAASATYNGTLNGRFTISAGTFNGACSFSSTLISGSPTFNTDISFTGTSNISGGTFGAHTMTANSCSVQISGGTFGTEIFARVGSGGFQITGGTYSPVSTVTVNASTGLLVTTNLPKDPGFALGGTYTPVLTVSNIPGVLGAGLP
jgi:hypothetical protein